MCESLLYWEIILSNEKIGKLKAEEYTWENEKFYFYDTLDCYYPYKGFKLRKQGKCSVNVIKGLYS